MIIIFLKCIFYFPFLLVKYIKEKKNKDLHLYGIYGYYGLAGKGKTMAMCQRLKELRKKYGDKIYITTNFYFDDEDFPLTHWKLLLQQYDKPIIVAYDELVNTFNSKDYKDFPIELFGVLTQVRKGHGMQILYTAQRWHMVDKNFRTLSFGCYECNTFLGGYTFAKMYDPLDYDHLCSESDYDKRRKIKPMKYVDFLQTDELRNCYNSYKMLESAKQKEYMSRSEVAAIDGSFFE